jgi:D-threo-aldose 1-dehydrogenase
MFDPISDEAAEATIRRAWDLGVRFFDTAPLYGNGLAEGRLGRALATKPRASFAVATKVGRPNRTESGECVFDYSYDGVMRSVETSLKRLRLDRVDVLHIHDPGDRVDEALAGAYRALARLRTEGVIGAVGAGTNDVRSLIRLAQGGNFDCFLIAGRYTLLDHVDAHALLAHCRQDDIALIVGGVYNSGILAAPGLGGTFDYGQPPPSVAQRAHQLHEVCSRYGVPLKAAAIQFPTCNPIVASVLSGSRSVAELEENLRMVDVPIPHAMWAELRESGLMAPESP